MKVTHYLFDVRLLKRPADISADIDILSHANYTQVAQLYRAQKLNIPFFHETEEATVTMFDNKLLWKPWMVKAGLGAHIAKIFDPASDPNKLPYPVVLKTNVHFGRGVFILHNAKDYRTTAGRLNSEKVPFLLEESLTGFGLSQLSVWGSAFRGKVLSLRCAKRTFDSADVTASAYRNSTVKGGQRQSYNATAVPYVKGFILKASVEQWLPCGKDITQIAVKMMAAARYTGPWCTQLKLDSQLRPKLMEVNARYCGSLASNDALFLATYVPLAVAAAKAYPDSALHGKVFASSKKQVFQDIQQREERVLRTAGGLYGGKWLEVEQFDANLRLDPIGQEYDPRSLFSSSKITTGVASSEVLAALRSLPLTSALFEFHHLRDVSSVHTGLDLVVSRRPSTLSHLLHGHRSAHLTLLRNTARTMTVLSERHHWLQWMGEVGLRSLVPAQYSVGDTIPDSAFPLTLSAKLAGATPPVKSFAVIDNAEISSYMKGLKKNRGAVFTLEERTTLVGSAYGSVMQGRLLALRCVTSDPSADKRAKKLILIACGTEVVKMVRKVFEASGSYTGPFCADLALNADQRPKLTDLNARLCDPVVRSDALFVSTFVPLAVALHAPAANATYVSSTVQRPWLTGRDIFTRVVALEKAVLASGGSDDGKIVKRLDPDRMVRYAGSSDSAKAEPLLAKLSV
jgi:hypothetical protein